MENISLKEINKRLRENDKEISDKEGELEYLFEIYNEDKDSILKKVNLEGEIDELKNDIERLKNKKKNLEDIKKANSEWFKNINLISMKEAGNINKEEYISLLKEQEAYAKESKKKKRKIIPKIFKPVLLVGLCGLLGFGSYKLVRNNRDINDESNDKEISIDNETTLSTEEDIIKETTGVSENQVDSLLNNTSESTTNEKKIYYNSTQAPWNQEETIIENDVEYPESTTTIYEEIIPESTTEILDETTSVSSSTEKSTESTENTSTIETIVIESTTEDPYDPNMPIIEDEEDIIYYYPEYPSTSDTIVIESTTEDPYDPNMPVIEDEEDIIYYENPNTYSSVKTVLSNFKTQLLNLKSSRTVNINASKLVKRFK